MNWFKKFFAGRYGGDQLSMALIILSLLLTIIGQLTRFPLLVFVSYVPLGISLFRILSKNISIRLSFSFNVARTY